MDSLFYFSFLRSWDHSPECYLFPLLLDDFQTGKGGPWKSMERRSLLNIALVLTGSENCVCGTLGSCLVFGHYNPCEEDLGEEDGVPEGHSVQFSRSVTSNSLWPRGLQHPRLHCPSPTLRACSNSSPLSQWCHPTISCSVSPSPPPFNLSQHQGLFQWVSSLYQVAKVLELQLSNSPSSEYSGLISFRIDWFDLLAVQGTQGLY